MSNEHTLEPHAILAALGLRDAGVAAPVSGGADTAIWRVEHAAGPLALRVFRANQTRAWQNELQALAAAAEAGIPVPAVRAAGMWRDRPAVALSWSAGRPLLLALQLQPWLASRLGRAFGRMQARIHRVAAPAGWSPTAWREWGAPHDPRVQARLDQLPPPAAALLHLDYHPLNVLTDGRRITAVLDWVNARAGDPRADVARTESVLLISPGGPRPTLLLRFGRRLLAHYWRLGYQQEHGRLGDLSVFHAWAGSVMLRDLAPRAARPGSDVQPADLARIAAWSEAQADKLAR